MNSLKNINHKKNDNEVTKLSLHLLKMLQTYNIGSKVFYCRRLDKNLE